MEVCEYKILLNTNFYVAKILIINFCIISAPLVNIKKALAKVKSDITMMDIAIAVLDNELVTNRLRDKAMLQQEFGSENAIF